MNDQTKAPERKHFEAFCSMRDAINEYIPMPSLESGLLKGPEAAVDYEIVAVAVIAEVTRLRDISAEQVREASAPNGTWMPISTAPLDGRYILTSLNWSNADEPELAVIRWCGSKLFPWRRPNEIAGGIASHVPTHWMPLPAPPQEATNE